MLHSLKNLGFSNSYFPELVISSTGVTTEFQGHLLGLYELQEETYKNHSVYKLKHTTGVENTRHLYT